MIKSFGVALVSLIVLDGIWLGAVAKDFYRNSLAPIARMADGSLDPIWPIAALVYPVIALGLAVFVVSRSTTAREALLYGALFGAISFAVYDLTNHSTLREWRAAMTIVDICWGTVSCATASWLAFALTK